MPSYKLTYFDGRGRAELCRLLFVLAGQDFQDVRIQRKDWPSFKNSTPFGQLPILDIDGKVFGQSVAICNYLAREFGFYGQSHLEQLSIDQVVGLVQDAGIVASKVYHESDSQRKASMLQDFKEKTVPNLLACCQMLLHESGSGFFVGSKMTLADLITWNFIDCNENRFGLSGLADDYPMVKAMFAKVTSVDRIKVYLASRPPADF